jgi:hypothetical protein
MADKAMALPRDKIKARTGALSQTQLAALDAALKPCLGLTAAYPMNA